MPALVRAPRVFTGVFVTAAAVTVAATAASGTLDASAALPGTDGLLPGGWGACDPGTSAANCDDISWNVPNNGAWAGVDNMVSVAVGQTFIAQGAAAESEGLMVVRGDATWTSDIDGYDIGVAGVGSRVTPADGEDFLLVGGDATVAAAATTVRAGAAGIAADGDRFGNIGVVGAHNFRNPTGWGTPPAGSYGALGQLDADNGANAYTNHLYSREDATLRLAAYDSLFDALPVYTQQCYSELAQAGAVTAYYDGGTSELPIEAAPGDLTISGSGATLSMPAAYPDAKIVTFDVDPSQTAALASVNSITMSGFPSDVAVLINLRGDTVDLNIGSFVLNGTIFYPGGATAAPDLVRQVVWNIPTASTINVAGGAQYPGSWLVGNEASTFTMAAAGFNGRMYTAGHLVHGNSGDTTGTGSEFHNYPFSARLGCVLNDEEPTTSPSASASPSTSPSTSASPSTTPSTTPSTSTSPSASASPSITPSTSASPSTTPSTTPSASTSPSASASPSTTPSTSASPSTTPSTTPSTSTSPSASASPSTTPSTSTSPSTTPSASTSPSASASPSTTPSTSASPSTSPSTTPSTSASPESSPSASASSSASPTPSETASVSPSTSPSASTTPDTSASPDTSESAAPEASASPESSSGSDGDNTDSGALSGTDSDLPATGVDEQVKQSALIAAALMGLGALLLVVARRKA